MWGKAPVKAVLFDIGGVIIHYRQEGFFQLGAMLFGCTPEALSAAATALLPALERGQIDSHKFWERLGQILEAAGHGRAQDPAKCRGLWINLLKDSLRMDPDMVGLVRTLQQRVPVGALSNTIEEHARWLEAYGAYDNFNPCVLSCEVGLRKPEKEIYRLAAELLNTPPKNILLIDDLPANIAGARTVKMQGHLFTDRRTLEAELRELNLLPSVSR